MKVPEYEKFRNLPINYYCPTQEDVFSMLKLSRKIEKEDKDLYHSKILYHSLIITLFIRYYLLVYLEEQ